MLFCTHEIACSGEGDPTRTKNCCRAGRQASVPAALAPCALYADLRRLYAAPAREPESPSEGFVLRSRGFPAGRALRSLVERCPDRTNPDIRIRSQAGALGSDDHALQRLRLLGLVLARSVSRNPADYRSDRLSIRAGHAGLLVTARQVDSRLWSDSYYLQHESVPVVSRRLVLPAVRHGRDYRIRQGIPEMETRRPAHSHLQSLRFCAFPGVNCPDRNSHDADHLGPADFDDFQ